jgi:protein-L-isoaspartate(D-aspartate) O-methyltransferase
MIASVVLLGGIVSDREQLTGWLGAQMARYLAFSGTLPQNAVAIRPAAMFSARVAGDGLREADMVDFRTARRAMVDGQVRTSDVTHLGLIAAMLEIPREAFVPESQAALAYVDRDVMIADAAATEPARYLMKPAVLARLIQAVDPAPQERALVVGAGTGYAAAVISRLVAAVVALEQSGPLVLRARAVLSSLGCSNVTTVQGPLTGGAPASAPYDVILIDGGVETLPQGLSGQLTSRGRLVAVEGAGPIGKATLFQSVNGKLGGRVLFDANAPVLPGFNAAPAFVF